MNNDSRRADRLVLLNSFASPVEAAIVCEMLEANGVKAILDNATLNSVLPLSFNAVRLMVWESQYDDALKLLEENGDD